MQCYLRQRWPAASRPRRPVGNGKLGPACLSLLPLHLHQICHLFPATNRDYVHTQRCLHVLGATKRNATSDKPGWDAAEYDVVGPAFQATLDMLEWTKLCEHVARFASTHAGKRACRSLLVPEDPRETLRLLEQTRAITVLEYDWATSLDYGGIQTSEAESGLSRAAKGGMLSAQQLRAVVTLVNGGDRLRKQVVAAARENDALRADSPVRVLLAAVGQLRQQPFLVRSVMTAIDEDANVQDSASEQLRGLRARVKAIQGRLASLLKGYGGEVSDRGGRICVAVPAGTKIPNGVLLGSSPGGSLQYVEPPAAVGLNNELGAARAEAQAAEEAVLWELTGLVMGALDELENTFRVVAWLDVLSARARYGIWIRGVLPEIVPWDTVFHARGGAAMRRRAQEGSQGGEGEADDYGDGSLMRDPEERYAVRLRGLRHPLLYGEYLTQKESLERVVRMSPSPPSGAGFAPSPSPSVPGSTAGAGAGASKRRLLGTRKEVLLRRSGSGSGYSSGSDSDGEGSGSDTANTPQAALAALQPPRPVDWVVRPDTSVVVITGPNTGGKTAAMKALGLAACMAKAGLPLPAEAPARLPAFSAVLADIGDEQSLTANLSTFSGHLRRIQALRAEADGKSLLLLDELGTGTDPLEGAALGVALLKRLVRGGVGSGALTVATTHHSVMTGLKFDDPRFENASVEFDEVALAPTYKLLWGIPGRSNALNIAARLGLDEGVVAAARSRLDVGVATVNSAIEQLEALRGQLDEEERGTWEADMEVKTLTRKLKAMHTAVEALHDKLTRARAEALMQVYTLARDRIREIKKARKRLGRSAPPPKPLLAAQEEHPDDEKLAEDDPRAADAAATGDDAEPPPHIPSEEEIWEAWEAASRARAANSVSAAAIGAPKLPGPAAAAAAAAAGPPVPPAVAAPEARRGAGAVSSPGGRALPADPLRPLLELSGDLSEGALGLEALVEDLAAQERQALMGQALEKQREEALYDAALAALDGILDSAAAKNEEPQPQQRQQQQQPGQQQQRKAPRSGRARAAGRASVTSSVEESEEEDADLAALMAILEEGEAALSARVRQVPPGSGPGAPPGQEAQGHGSQQPRRQQQQQQPMGAAAASAAAMEDDDLDAELGDLDALVEETSWALQAAQQAQHGQQGRHQQAQQQEQAQQQHRRAHRGETVAEGGGGARDAEAGPEDDETARYLERLMEGATEGRREMVTAVVGASPGSAAAVVATAGDRTRDTIQGGARERGNRRADAASSQQAGQQPRAGTSGGNEAGAAPLAAPPQQQQPSQRQRRGRRNW